MTLFQEMKIFINELVTVTKRCAENDYIWNNNYCSNNRYVLKKMIFKPIMIQNLKFKYSFNKLYNGCKIREVPYISLNDTYLSIRYNHATSEILVTNNNPQSAEYIIINRYNIAEENIESVVDIFIKYLESQMNNNYNK